MKSSNLQSESIGNFNFFTQNLGLIEFDEAQKVVRELTTQGDNLAAMGCLDGDKGTVILAKSDSVSLDCGAILKEALASVGGSGGGKQSYAQGACSKEKLNDALEKIRSLVS